MTKPDRDILLRCRYSRENNARPSSSSSVQSSAAMPRSQNSRRSARGVPASPGTHAASRASLSSSTRAFSMTPGHWRGPSSSGDPSQPTSQCSDSTGSHPPSWLSSPCQRGPDGGTRCPRTSLTPTNKLTFAPGSHSRMPSSTNGNAH